MQKTSTKESENIYREVKMEVNKYQVAYDVDREGSMLREDSKIEKGCRESMLPSGKQNMLPPGDVPPLCSRP